MLDDLKIYLDIDYDDKDRELNRIINSSKNYLEDIAGIKLDFPAGSSNEDLLFNCCRYKFNKAFEYFEQNFRRELLKLQFKSVVTKNDTNEQYYKKTATENI